MKIKALFIAISIIAFLVVPAMAADVSSDPLPSWNDGKTKQAILDFVAATTTKGSPDFVPTEARIATFDQDGTLFVEKPLYTEFVFALDQIKLLYPKHPEWKTTPPFSTILSGDRAAIEKLNPKDMAKIVAVSHSGMTVDQFKEVVRQWLATAKHPRFHKPYTALVYQPMLEVINYLTANGYKSYIVTAGGQDFVRVYSDDIYAIPPERVVGTAGQTKYTYGQGGKSELVKLPKVLMVDDKAGKPSAINLMIGRRPYASFGNSDGDQQMLEWTEAGIGKRLMMLVHHDDAKREYSYGNESKIGRFSDALMTEANQRNWNVISVKDDWKVVFP